MTETRKLRAEVARLSAEIAWHRKIMADAIEHGSIRVVYGVDGESVAEEYILSMAPAGEES